jgi:hypothetical protein
MLSQRVAVTKVNGTSVIDNRIPRKPARNVADQKYRFTAASVWARDQMAIPAAKAAYAAAVTKSKPTPYRVAMTDYLSAPHVREIDVFDYHGAIGDLISVTAFDDFMVTRVEVIINDATGKVIEKGDATLDAEKVFTWFYKTGVANPVLAGTTIKAIAYDRPGNKGTAEVVL